jgi:arylformamidase
MRALRNGHGALRLKARVRLGSLDAVVDLGRPASLAMELRFEGRGPRHFGAPAASSQPLVLPGFSGSVARGASCNCSTITLTPHCNGTHTECAGHLTAQPLDAFRIVPPGLIPAVLVTVTPESATAAGETSNPPPGPQDRLITRRLLTAALPAADAPSMMAGRALVIRTRQQRSGDTPTPYLSYEAAVWIVEQGIEHLVVDLPSIDRLQDEGLLTAHRVFFGLPPGSSQLDRARRPQCTITELACVPESLADGEYLLELQIPALAGDAVPSRPLLYTLEAHSP